MSEASTERPSAPPPPPPTVLQVSSTVVAPLPPPPSTEAVAKPTKAESALGVAKFNKERGGQPRIGLATSLPILNHVSTGVFALDLALLGGFAENTPFMIYGLESSSKTTLALKMVANFQRKYPDMMCAWVDAETTFDRIWALKHGVDLSRLYFSQPESGEEAVDQVEMFLGCKDVSLVIVDSIPALVPVALQERSAEDKVMAGNSALIGVMMSKYLAKICAERLRGHYPTLGIINQIRDSMASYGSPYKIPGGRQLKFQVQTWVRMKGSKKMDKDAFGCEVPDHIEQSFVIEKNKIGSSLMQGEYKMALNPDFCKDKTLPEGLQLPIGTIYEVKTIMSQAKRMDLITGNGGAWRVDGIDHTFRKNDDIELFLYQNPEHNLRLRQIMIGIYRRNNGLPSVPPDGHLLSWDLYQ